MKPRCVQGDKEFNVEVSTLSRLSHPCIVSLLGICVEGDQRIAVFELLPRGSLSAALCQVAGGPHAAKQAPARGPGRPGQQRLPWKERVQIALDIARGLAYLHKVGCFLHCNRSLTRPLTLGDMTLMAQLAFCQLFCDGHALGEDMPDA